VRLVSREDAPLAKSVVPLTVGDWLTQGGLCQGRCRCATVVVVEVDVDVDVLVVVDVVVVVVVVPPPYAQHDVEALKVSSS